MPAQFGNRPALSRSFALATFSVRATKPSDASSYICDAGRRWRSHGCPIHLHLVTGLGLEPHRRRRLQREPARTLSTGSQKGCQRQWETDPLGNSKLTNPPNEFSNEVQHPPI
jgi:hypothetical protein